MEGCTVLISRGNIQNWLHDHCTSGVLHMFYEYIFFILKLSSFCFDPQPKIWDKESDHFPLPFPSLSPSLESFLPHWLVFTPTRQYPYMPGWLSWARVNTATGHCLLLFILEKHILSWQQILDDCSIATFPLLSHITSHLPLCFLVSSESSVHCDSQTLKTWTIVLLSTLKPFSLGLRWDPTSLTSPPWNWGIINKTITWQKLLPKRSLHKSGFPNFLNFSVVLKCF